MKHSAIALLWVTIPVFILFAGCSDEETYPVTPAIQFVSLQKYSSLSGNDSLELIFSFTDGDGDLGSPPSDSLSRDIFVKLFEQRNGVFVEANLSAPLEYRMPYLEPRGNNESLKGEVKINIDYNILQINDTIYYELFIRDRAGRKSNEITTTTIVTRVQ